MNKAVLIFPLVLFSLLAAIWSGWIRMGWTLPVSNTAAQHGALMVNSFLATLIFLERAVAFRKKWVLLLPAVNGLSGVAFFFDLVSAAQFLMIAGSAGFVVMCVYFIYRFRELYYYVFLAGALCLFAGNFLLYKNQFYPVAVTWWMGFLLFTIVAERLELSRFLPLNNFKRGLLVASLASVLVALVWPFHLQGNVFLAITIAITALWLLKYDMARHSIRVKGQHRYSGLLLITGYFWLLVTAVLLVAQDRMPFGYDAALHSFFIGFVFSMIFSHAPIILPAVARLPVKIYRPVLYVWFVLLQLTLVIRIAADIGGKIDYRRISGMLNGMVILLFFITIIIIVRLELMKSRSTGSPVTLKSHTGASGKAP